MMPLTDKTVTNEKGDEKISGALSTEEIVSLLNKSNKDFIKESILNGDITNSYDEAKELMIKKGKNLGLSVNE